MSSIGHRSCKRIIKEKTPLLHKLCAFRCLNLRPHLMSRNQFKSFREKLFLAQFLRDARGSRFSQIFILSTALHCALPKKFLCWQIFWVRGFIFFCDIFLKCNQRCQVQRPAMLEIFQSSPPPPPLEIAAQLFFFFFY